MDKTLEFGITNKRYSLINSCRLRMPGLTLPETLKNT